MRRICVWAAAACVMTAAWHAGPRAQTSGKAHWLMNGGDPARTSWQRNETIISPSTVKDMKLMWAVKLDNEPRQMHNLFAPLIIGDLQMPNGRREVAVIAG